MAVIIVTLVSFVVLSLVALTLASGQGAQTSSARDRNFDLALGAAEAGVHEAIARVNASGGTFTGDIGGGTDDGSYDGAVMRNGDTITIDMTGTTGGATLGKQRRVRVTMSPPLSFPFALFSETSIEVKNNGTITGGDVWANDSVLLQQDDVVDGSVTAAQSWARLEGGSHVTGNLWSGGTHTTGAYAIKMHNNARVDGWAKASVSAPSDPTTCGGADPDAYEVQVASGAAFGGDLTTWGVKTGSGNVGGVYRQNVCTEAPAAIPLPQLNPAVYDDAVPFTSVDEFQSYLTTNGGALSGVFVVTDPSPTQSNQVDLSGVSLAGDTTIVTNAPVFTNNLDDEGVADEAIFVLASDYTPPTGTSCNVDHDFSECAIHVKNNFQTDCRTAVLIYADNGPVSIKNNQEMCGAVAAQSILIKNNQIVDYDPRIARLLGFGEVTFEVTRWEELSV